MENVRNSKKNSESVNPLRNEKVKVEFVPQKSGLAPENPKHVLSGGMAAGAKTLIGVPMLRSTGAYKNVLTNDEKDFLENILGLDSNALSVYKKVNNYWDNFFITIPKEGIVLNLSDPEDYIRYKVLLANSDIIAPSKKELQDRPKATYRFVLTRDSEDTNLENAKMDATMQSYKEFGKIEDDIDTMRVLVELLDARPYSENTQVAFLRSRINVLIQADPKRFVSYITDPMLRTKVLIRRGVETGALSRRGDFYYLRSDNSPLCEANEEPTLSVAARYLNLPAHLDIKAILESEISKTSK